MLQGNSREFRHDRVAVAIAAGKTGIRTRQVIDSEYNFQVREQSTV
jgi:hypothetical protein